VVAGRQVDRLRLAGSFESGLGAEDAGKAGRGDVGGSADHRHKTAVAAGRAGLVQPGYSHVFVVPATGGTPKQITSGDYNHGAGRR